MKNEFLVIWVTLLKWLLRNFLALWSEGIGYLMICWIYQAISVLNHKFEEWIFGDLGHTSEMVAKKFSSLMVRGDWLSYDMLNLPGHLSIKPQVWWMNFWWFGWVFREESHCKYIMERKFCACVQNACIFIIALKVCYRE